MDENNREHSPVQGPSLLNENTLLELTWLINNYSLQGSLTEYVVRIATELVLKFPFPPTVCLVYNYLNKMSHNNKYCS